MQDYDKKMPIYGNNLIGRTHSNASWAFKDADYAVAIWSVKPSLLAVIFNYLRGIK
jgi:hypothetical protein